MRMLQIGLPAILAAAVTASAHAQTIQLPTFHYTTVNTTVSVPVNGEGIVGGMSASATAGGAQMGVPGLAGKVLRKSDLTSGRVNSATGAIATLIDHDQLDKSVRAHASLEASSQDSEDPLILRKADKLTRAIRQQSSLAPAEENSPPLLSVAAIERQNSAQDLRRQREIEALLVKGDQAEAAGKRSVAKIYYGMASRQADGDLKQQALARLAAFAKSSQGASP